MMGSKIDTGITRIRQQDFRDLAAQFAKNFANVAYSTQADNGFFLEREF